MGSEGDTRIALFRQHSGEGVRGLPLTLGTPPPPQNKEPQKGWTEPCTWCTLFSFEDLVETSVLGKTNISTSVQPNEDHDIILCLDDYRYSSRHKCRI
jgi:hypothetical protein